MVSGLPSLYLSDEAAMRRLGEDLALALGPGDVVYLEGDLGAGKSTLARAVIRAIADDETLEVPSPTFTIVQSYALGFNLHHLDLYRLASADELEELGIDELAQDGAILVEWPERGAGLLPPPTLIVRLEPEGEGRRAHLEAEPSAQGRFARTLEIRDFLAGAGWPQVHRRFLLGDASTRAYETIGGPGAAARILMNAPRRPDGPPVRDGKPYSQIAHLAESVDAFVAIDGLLRQAGFAAPQIHAADLGRGLLLTEHLGDGDFLGPGRHPIAERYRAAAELLAEIHVRRWPESVVLPDGTAYRIPVYDRGAMLIETELLTDWYVPHVTGSGKNPAMARAYADAWNAVLDRLTLAEQSLVLRDFHSPNIIWRDAEAGLARLGLIDFQDAVIGPAAYDVASLALDARVTIPPDLQAETVDAYVQARRKLGDFDRTAFDEAFAIMGAQRSAKILGIFVRLNKRDGKARYLAHLPRVRDYLARCLRHPSLAPVASFCARYGILEAAEA